MLWCSKFTPGLNWLSLKDWCQQLTQPAWLHFLRAKVSCSVRWGPNKWPLIKWSYSLQLQSTVRRFGKVFGLVCSSKLSACLNEWGILRRVSDSTNRDRNKNNRENTAARTTATTASLWMVLWKTTYSENAIVQNADLSHWLQCKQLKLKKMVYAAYAIEAKKIRVLRYVKINWVFNWAQSHL